MAYTTAPIVAEFVQCDAANAELLVRLASGAVDGYVLRSLQRKSYTEVLPVTPPGVVWVTPANWPLTVDSVICQGQTLVNGEDYSVDDGAVRFTRPARWRGRDVKVAYAAGFDDGSPELATAERVVLEVAARAMANPQDLDSFGSDGSSASFRRGPGPVSLSNDHRADLRPLRWRRVMA